MKYIMTIFRHDLFSFMIVPTGAIVAALFSLACGIVFVSQVLSPNSIVSMRPVFEFAAWLLLLLCPAITMGLISEERRLNTWELILSSPSSAFEIAKGKFLAAWVFLLLILATTFPLILVLEIYSSVDYGAVASGYLGLMMLGGAVIASGLFVSALTTSQTVSYLVTAFFWLTISLATKVLPAYVPTRFADFIFALDPDLRTGEFAIGLIDTANIVYFLSIGLAIFWITIVAIEMTRRNAITTWRIMISATLLLFSLVAINSIAMNESVRERIDVTGSRAYTLSEQTAQLLDSIDKPWKIVVLLDDTEVERSVLRQVDEVLRRYQDGSEFVSVTRINPTDSDALIQYDELLRDLIQLYGDELSNAEQEIQDGVDTFKSLMVFASSTSAWAEALASVKSTSDEEETLRTLSGALALLGNEGGLILEEIEKSMKVDSSQPLPRISTARDVLVAATGRWSKEIAEVARWLGQSRSSSISTICSNEAPSFENMARELAQQDDALRRLGTLELGQLATQLSVGEGAIIMSPKRATMIPASLIFPKSVGNQMTVATDQRFRGEQIVSSAMRSLQSTLLPTVVFVHAEEKSLMSRRDNNVDLWAARGLLETSRIDVREWVPFDGSRPNIGDGPVVWVVIPPSSRAGLEISQREQALLDSVKDLLARNEPLMLNMQPSLLPRYGQKDPWAKLVESIGLSVDTEKVLAEQVAVGPNKLGVQKSQMINEMNSEHLISRAVNGRQIYFPLPVSVQGGMPLIMIEPSEDRWFEPRWETKQNDIGSNEPITNSVSIANAVVHHGGARAIVVGSSGWLLSWAADRATSLGGNKIVMVNPGNSEFLLASVEWLAGLDDWIAAGPIGQQSNRVSGLSKNAYFVWTALLIIVLPALLLGSTVFISMRRHRQ